jgi:ATP-dependent helicase HepA
MQDFAPGQRWISDSEPELGLGLIIEIEGRRLTVEFPKSAETRHYAKDNAPLSRISFNPGDQIQDRNEKTYEIINVETIDGLLIYQVRVDNTEELHPLPETALSDSISLDQPLDRLLSGQIDHNHWFQLRTEALKSLNFIEQSSLLGLCSGRTELIPHQLYISNEVAQRYAPRVLLADEVGLGKTIEACLILQQQLFSGLASRILIIVPETLLHQWLVELLRRFNLAFSIFDAERCVAIIEESATNPFFSEQLILCCNELFIHSPELHQQALLAEWDLLIIDEAHHLRPPSSEDKNDLSAENVAYSNIESFSTKVKGLILLTATPDQLGRESHFALLRLLDPDRFHDFDDFTKEQNNFIQITKLIELLENLDLSSNQHQVEEISKALTRLLNDDDIPQLLAKTENDADRKKLIKAIVDRHGTGRILFRNTRKIIAGFPQRKLHSYPLDCPSLYQAETSTLWPEINFLNNPEWLKEDPRVHFLEQLLKKLKQEKILLICAHKKTVTELEEYLRLRKGIRSSVFHEDMSIMERDRSAAYFSDNDEGAQILLCSEIGSEGRNFQFSHHLVLFDLPVNPDLLEQRIGRLDRIGQKYDINIHVPYLNSTAQETLFLWYQKGLNAFEQTNPAAFKVFQQQEIKLNEFITNPFIKSEHELHDFIQQVTELNRQSLAELSNGRDRLLEINSFDAEQSQSLIKEIKLIESGNSPQTFLNQVFDSFGIDAEENSDHSWVVKPGDQMVIDSFPTLPDQGMTLTYQREKALHREDIQFVSWHHPLMGQSIDLVLQGDFGKSSIAVLQDKRLESGSFLLESIYRVSCQAAKELQLNRFLPSTTMRVLMDSQHRDLSKAISTAELNKKCQHVDKSHLMTLLNENKTPISEVSHLSEQCAMKQLPTIIKHSNEQMLVTLSAEIKRLVALKEINPNIRNEEIEFLKNQVLSLHKAFANANLQREGIRLIFIA